MRYARKGKCNPIWLHPGRWRPGPSPSNARASPWARLLACQSLGRQDIRCQPSGATLRRLLAQGGGLLTGGVGVWNKCRASALHPNCRFWRHGCAHPNRSDGAAAEWLAPHVASPVDLAGSNRRSRASSASRRASTGRTTTRRPPRLCSHVLDGLGVRLGETRGTPLPWVGCSSLNVVDGLSIARVCDI